MTAPLQNKQGDTVAEALHDMFQKFSPPKKLQTDQGKEFYNLSVKTLLQENNIKHYSVFSDKKA